MPESLVAMILAEWRYGGSEYKNRDSRARRILLAQAERLGSFSSSSS